MLIAYDGIARPIAFEGCETVYASLTTALRGWRFEKAMPDGVDPAITIRRRNGRYQLESPSLGGVIHQPTDTGALCALIADLIQVYIAGQSSLLCLHCGAVASAKGLVIFPNQYRAGKSTLVARLAAAGLPVFADDVLPIARGSGEGVALGIAPRLRLPLPDNASRAFRRFVDNHRGPSDSRYLYLDLPSDALARHGLRMPITACVLLDRQAAGDAQLVPAAKSAALQRIILQNFARSVPAADIADELRALVSRVPCFTLHYSDLEDATRLLREAFEGRLAMVQERSDSHTSQRAPSQAEASSGRRRPRLRRRSVGARRYLRDPSIRLDVVEGDGFLIDPRSQSIYHLNPVAAGLWRLLAEPTTLAEAIETLCGAFPDVDERQVERDLWALLADLLARRLVQRARSQLKR